MKAISPILKRLVYPVLAKTNTLAESAGVAVLTYHGVFPDRYEILDPVLDGALVTRTNLRQQFEVLRKRYNVITPEEFRANILGGRPLPVKSVLLTCDDGLLNTVTDMLRVLNDYEFKCLFFVTGASAAEASSMLWDEELLLMLRSAPKVSALCLEDLQLSGTSTGKRHVWEFLSKALAGQDACRRRDLLTQIRDRAGLPANWLTALLENETLRRRFQLLSPDGLRHLAAAGMSIGAHSMTHPVLSKLSDEDAQAEISNSLTGIEKVLGQKVWALAYPYGDSASVTQREVRMAEAAGFQCAFLNVGGGLGATMPRYEIPRVHVTADMNIAEFEVHISGVYRNLRRNLRSVPRQAAAII
jgi:peptidoglycan/xylan/chitin deacetylase (PgdA/CDA1 family)